MKVNGLIAALVDLCYTLVENSLKTAIMKPQGYLLKINDISSVSAEVKNLVLAGRKW
jgi:hypothetical protein